MKNKDLKNLIKSVCEEVILEQNVSRQNLANTYVKAIKRKDPKLHDILMRQALFAIKSVKNKEKPRYSTEDANKLLKFDLDADPRTSGDTHGVRLFIDHLIDDAAYAGKAKRFYQMVLDNLIKNTFAKK